MILFDCVYTFHLLMKHFLSVNNVLGILLGDRDTVGQSKVSHWTHRDYVLKKTMTKETKLFWFPNKGKK